LERKSKGGREIARKERIGRRGSTARAKTKPAMTFGVADEATTASAGNNGACSDRGN